MYNSSANLNLVETITRHTCRFPQIRQEHAGEEQIQQQNAGCRSAQIGCQPVHVYHNIQQRFANVGVKIGDAFAKFVNIGRQQLVGVRYSVV